MIGHGDQITENKSNSIHFRHYPFGKMSELRCDCRMRFWALHHVLEDMPFLDGLAGDDCGAPLIGG